MIVDEIFFEKAKQADADYSSGIILPDGEYILTDSHLQSLVGLTGLPEEQVWEMIPREDSALFWLIDYTGCVITDYNSCVGVAMTEAQERTYRALVSHGILTDKYYDITNERSRAADAQRK